MSAQIAPTARRRPLGEFPRSCTDSLPCGLHAVGLPHLEALPADSPARRQQCSDAVPDPVPKSVDGCQKACCADATCDAYQYSDTEQSCVRGTCLALIPLSGWEGETGKSGSGNDPKPPPNSGPHIGPVNESDCATLLVAACFSPLRLCCTLFLVSGRGFLTAALPCVWWATGGWSFMIFLAIVAGLYVSGGAVYNYKVTQEVSLPHRDFCTYPSTCRSIPHSWLWTSAALGHVHPFALRLMPQRSSVLRLTAVRILGAWILQGLGSVVWL